MYVLTHHIRDGYYQSHNSASKVSQHKKLWSPWLGAYLSEDVYGLLYKVHSQNKAECIHHHRLEMSYDVELPLRLLLQCNLTPDLDEKI